MSLSRALAASALVLGAGACASAGSAPAAASSAESEHADGFRVVAPSTGEEIAFARMVDRLARADVVFFGEQHDDPETHRAELAVLEGLGRTGRPVVLSLEMFERDVQAVVDEYVAGRLSEAEFLARSRPWPRYATDYRPLVEMAKARRWPVVAANVPRPLASAIGRRGLAALDTLTGDERRTAAAELVCPDDDYRARFLETMRTHSAGSGTAPQPGDTLPAAIAERFYLSQCAKDETMAESIVDARRSANRAIVLHVTGAFHSDYAQGVVDRVRRREPGWNLVVISAVPVRDVALASVAPHRGRADFVIFTRDRRTTR